MIKFIFIFLFNFFGPKDSDPITHIGLYNEILEQGIEFPDIVFAQAILESSHFKSKIYRENNNIFGMKIAKRRTTTSTGSRNGFSVYSSWRESIIDYYYYQEMILSKRKMNREQYFSFLDKNYAKGQLYSKKLKDIINKYKNILYTPPIDRNDGNLPNDLILP
jgi:flagellum-specific peptidoglycan hydrolase FlgJ